MPSRIYTKTGDRGETGLFGGRRVPKDDLRIEAYGTTDELNTVLGAALTHCNDVELEAVLRSIQEDLFQLGADLATPPSETTQRGRVTIQRMEAAGVERLEREIDRWEAELEPLRSFILPGGHPLGAALHQARAVCRRAERRCVALMRADSEPGVPAITDHVLMYLNRLSDLLFVLARAANQRNAVADIPWKP
jgi:cob(I)alamin adenosyltransferase